MCYVCTPFQECCQCCQLGLLARASDLPCTIPATFSQTCIGAFESCCSGEMISGTTVITTPLPTLIPPGKPQVQYQASHMTWLQVYGQELYSIDSWQKIFDGDFVCICLLQQSVLYFVFQGRIYYSVKYCALQCIIGQAYYFINQPINWSNVTLHT